MTRFNAPGVRFGRSGNAEAAPVYVGRGEAKRKASLKLAAEVLTVLPGPGESLHALMTGRYDLMHVALAIIGRLGTVNALRIATLSYSVKNLNEMVQLLESGSVRRLTVLASAFFRDHNRELWQSTREELHERDQHCAAARTHAKVITFDFASGVKLALHGSANLRTNSNIEQIALVNDAGLHDWFGEWIDATVAAHEGEDDDESAD